MVEMKSPVLLLLLSVCAWCRGETSIMAVTGSHVTFTADVNSQPSEISWLKKDIKIVDVEEGKEPDFYTFYDIRDRVLTNLVEKTFILMNVTPEDSGNYKAVPVVNGKVFNFFFRLLVLDRVCNVCIQNTTDGNNVTLRCVCSTKGAHPSQYVWRNKSGPVSYQQNYTVVRTQMPQTFQCNASNAVSSSHATVTVPPLPEKRNHIIIIILISLIVSITIIAIVLCVLYKVGLLACGRQRRAAPTETEKPLKRAATPSRSLESEAGAVDPAVNKERESLKNGRAEDQETPENDDESNTKM